MRTIDNSNNDKTSQDLKIAYAICNAEQHAYLVILALFLPNNLIVFRHI